MNNSSAPPVYSITLDDTTNFSGFTAQEIDTVVSDTITITGASGSSDCIVLDLSGGGSNAAFGYSAITTSTGISNVAIGSITTSGLADFDFDLQEEFVHRLPELDRIKKMCEEYPGLKVAYEKFVTTYKLVKDDYDTPKDKRVKP